ncbi:unnamed protein product [Protopolystoma xenopodis]|uniref:Uncharacterized protein n=1 Tax=Protopolystoma xenopodis TaxID=117903 RepID=A0A3S5AW43_9PLAT|nr:unnamed protein product [Protopolystoma xenopodis]
MSYPYILIFSTPQGKHLNFHITYSFILTLLYLPVFAGCQPELQLMYAASLANLVRKGEVTKVFEIRDLDEMDEEWLENEMKIFR